MSSSRLRSWAPCLLAVLATLVLAGCGDADADKRLGGGGGEEGGTEDGGTDAGSADSPQPFIQHFARVTGVRLRPVKGDLLGTRLEVPAKPNRFIRFGAYQLLWTKDDDKREQFLGKDDPDDDGIYWRRVGTSYSASKPYGDRLVLRWVGRQEKETNGQWDRLQRAVQAAVKGTLGPLESEERPCGDKGLDPLRGRTGACSVRGIPITFVEADDELDVPALEARVLGFGYANEIRNPGFAPLRPKGRFLIVAYRVTNKSESPISFVHPELRLGGRRVPASPDAAAMLPRSRGLPLPPGETLETRAAFDVDEAVEPRSGAFVLPAEREGKTDPTPLLAEGWIRLAKASPRLPKPVGAPGKGDPAAEITPD